MKVAHDSHDEVLAAAFGRRVAAWSQREGAPPPIAELVGRAALEVSRATSDGHSCVALTALAETLGDLGGPLDPDALRNDLLRSRVVGVPGGAHPLPFVLDEARLYLHRYFDYECRLAAALTGRACAADELPAHTIALLEALFAGNAREPGAPDWQKIAAITTLLGRLTIVSGGPGTGKTTTVVNLLAALLAADPACRIALTAPTGKAAARLTEVILHRAAHLPDPLRAALPRHSSTIHRLLGVKPDGSFHHDTANPLPLDVLVVDEASMLDLALAAQLLEAVPLHARVILLGDKDQLAAVESGAVFAELSAAPRFSRRRLALLAKLGEPAIDVPDDSESARPDGADAALEDCVIWLRRNYRFVAGSAIGPLASDINRGDTDGVLARLATAADDSLRWIDDPSRAPAPAATQLMFDGYASYIAALREHAHEPPIIAAAFARFRVLCALRSGAWGVEAVNQLLSRHLRKVLHHPLDPGLRSEWYPGRPVMIERNDPVLALFNGDLGLTLPDAHGDLRVYFPDASGGFRALPPARLPEHDTAFAMTVHKSQGSEFDAVLLMLPAEPARVLTRELFYTAVTRARHTLTLVANAAVIASTIATPTRRASGLSARLAQVTAREEDFGQSIAERG